MGSTKKWQRNILLTVISRADSTFVRDLFFPIRWPAIQFLEDKAVVVAAVKAYPFVLRIEFIPDKLLKDRDVFLAFAESTAAQWKDEQYRLLVSRFSVEIRSNVTLMSLLVEKCGLCFEFVDESLKGDLDIYRAACKENPKVWTSFPPSKSTRSALLNEKAFVLSLFRRPNLHWLYKHLPEFLQHDTDVAVKATLYNFSVEDIPVTVRTRDFWLKACQLADDFPNVWRHLPNCFHNDPEFLSHYRFESEEEVQNALRENPQFAGDRAFWTAAIKSTWLIRDSSDDDYLIHNTIQNFAEPTIRRDRDLMLLAVKEEPNVYGILNERLQEDREILVATMESFDFSGASSIPPRVQTMYPDLIARAVRATDACVSMGEIAPELWTSVEVMTSLVDNRNRFGGTLPRGFPDAMKNNEEFGLFATRYCDQPTTFEAFTSVALRSNEEFMKKAVALNPVCRFAGVGELSHAFDIAVIAFSHHIYSPSVLFGNIGNNDDDDYASELDFLHFVAAEARERVVAFEWFARGFLFGLIDMPGSDCLLPILVQGKATVTALTDTIGEFAGVPLRKDVARLRAASLNLLFMGSPDDLDKLSFFCSKVLGDLDDTDFH